MANANDRIETAERARRIGESFGSVLADVAESLRKRGHVRGTQCGKTANARPRTLRSVR